MTPVDDLKPGMFVAIVGERKDEPAPEWGLFGPSRTPVFNGVPYKILAVSLPFLCVTDGRKRGAIDVRQMNVQRVSKQYVREMTGEDASQQATEKRRWPKRRRQKAKPDPRNCKRCGERMVERLVVKPGENEWEMICPQCGFDSGRVTK